MKISILSDFHFGHGLNSEIEEDSFQNAQESISKTLDSDLILISGDIFDTRIPKTEMWANALRTLSKPILSNNTGIKLVETIGKELKEISHRTLNGIPVLALHGTHERRSKEQINTIQALEETGFLIHLHCNGIVLKKNGQKIAIQGMSGVPERYAKQIMDKWDPKPIEGCYNILMLHQSIEPYVYSPLEPPTLNLSNLPEGFDLIVAGHIHNHHLTKIGKTVLLMPGSMITTQLKKEESEVDKGFCQLSLPERKIEFIKLENARKFIFREFILDDQEPSSEQIEKELESILKKNYPKKPLVRMKITGELMEKELKQIHKKYEDKLILRISKLAPEKQEKIDLFQKLKEEKLSVEEMGMKLLSENLEQLKFSGSFHSEDIFKLLIDGKTQTAMNILTGKQTTLKGWKE